MKNILKASFQLDLRSLALTRILFGLIIFLSLVERMRDLEYHYTDNGVLDRSELLKAQPIHNLSIHLTNGTLPFQFALFSIHCFVCLCIVIGWHTTFFCCTQWFLYISLSSGFSIFNNAGDSVARALSFYSMLLPLGKVWSVDSLKNSKKKNPEELRFQFSNLVGAAYIIHVLIFYMSSTFHKNGEYWRNGTAPFYAVSYITMKGLFSNLMRNLPLSLIKIMSFIVLKWEFYGPLLYISPIRPDLCRYIAILGFVSLHIGFGMTIHLGMLTWVSILTNLPFLPSSFWNYLFFKLKKTDVSIVCFYDHSSLSYYIQKFITLFLPNYVSTLDSSQLTSHGKESSDDLDDKIYLSVHKTVGQHRIINFKAIVYILKDLIPLTKPIGWILNVIPSKMQSFIEKTIQKIHKQSMYDEQDKKREALKKSYLKIRKKYSRLKKVNYYLLQIFSLFIILSTIWFALFTTKLISFDAPSLMSTALKLTSIRITWAMYSPYPPPNSNVPIILGILNNDTVEFFSNSAIVNRSWEPKRSFSLADVDLEDISSVIGNSRWRKFFSKLTQKKHMNHFLRFVCREYNKRNKVKIIQVRLESFEVTSNLNKEYNVSSPKLLQTYQCRK